MRKAAAILELEPYLDRKPGQLSGGQRQRVAMGRAIVRQPAAFLMDEPLSNLDAKLRVQMRAEIARLQRDLGVTTIYVTHDQVEAMTMGDRVAVLKDGYLQQVDTPQNLYDEPINVFVAAFIGSPSMNLYEGELTLNGDGGSVQIGSQTRRPPARGAVEAAGACRTTTAQRVVVGIRPEDFEDATIATEAPADRRHQGQGDARRGARLRADGAHGARRRQARRLRRSRRSRGAARRGRRQRRRPLQPEVTGAASTRTSRSASPARTSTSSTPRPTRPSGRRRV